MSCKLSDDSMEDEDAFEPSSVDISPKLFRPIVKERRATTGCLDEGGRSRGYSENDLSIPPPSPMYYKNQSPCSVRNYPLRYDSKGSFASLQRYCSSLSIGSHLSQGPDNTKKFVIPSRTTPPRRSTMTATNELLHHIKKSGCKDYLALIKDKIDEDEPQVSSVTPSASIENVAEGSSLGNLLDFDDPFEAFQI